MLRRSAFVHLMTLNETVTLAIHAVTQLRVPLAPDMAALIGMFEAPVTLEGVLPDLTARFGHDEATLRACVLILLERGILSDRSVEEERAEFVGLLAPRDGFDAGTILDEFRRTQAEGSHPYWSVQAPRGLAEAGSLRRRLDVLLFGDCDVQMETDFLRREAARRGIDLRVAASFADDTALAGERRHDAVIVGALQARHAIVSGTPESHGGDPSAIYVSAMRAMLARLRGVTTAPILVNGLPEPTLQPLGAADRGMHSHRNRFRRTNLALDELAASLADVHLVDLAAAFGAAGASELLDDGLTSFTHFGSAGWMLQRPASELAAVHGSFPDMTTLAARVGGDPYRREAIAARAHLDALTTVLALDRKKCVIVDLDGVLWPGVLAETGAPFAWTPEVSGPFSYIGLYFGIHEALRALRDRGVILACVSKNDEATVRRLWRFPSHYPHHRLLTPESFVTWRVNWDDKAANIRSIAAELGFALESFVFVDDSERERERVRQGMPEVMVLGEDLFGLRRTLLTDPRLQPARLTREAAGRSEMVRAQLERGRLKDDLADAGAFLDSLAVVSDVERLTAANACKGVLARTEELFERTTQFNATGRKFSVASLERLIETGGRVFTLTMRDRLADHGLVGAAVVSDGEILNLAMSCRVIGLHGERKLLAAVLADAGELGALRGEIVATDRNVPVRHVYAENGFAEAKDGWWIARRGR